MIAHIMGCSRIGLLGIDGARKNGCRYFWQMNPPLYKHPYRNDGVSVDKYRKVKVRGQINDYDLIDIVRTWASFGEAVNKKGAVYNCSESSVLTIFPKTKLQELLDESSI